MIGVATAINSFASHGTQIKSVPPDDPVLEIPLSEFQDLLSQFVETYNQLAELVRDTGISRGPELAKVTAKASDTIKAARSPLEKILLVNTFMRQHLAKIRGFLKTKPAEGGKVIQVCSKIMARAVKIIDYIKSTVQDDPLRRKEISFDSQQARILFSGAGGEPVSRRDTIRAMRKAEKMWPALNCGHRPNDGRQTMRLIGKTEDLKDSPIIGYRDLWQRSDRRVSISL
jgi:hypothetical protein